MFARSKALLFFLATLALVTAAQAQDIAILHNALTAETLPLPGRSLDLGIQVKGVPNIDGVARIFLVSDGRLMEFPMQGNFSERDEVLYSATLWAPLAEMSYQFVFYPPSGTPVVSKRYQIKRSCIPRWEPKEIKIEPGLSTEGRVKALIKATRDLETDNKGYEQVLNLVSAIVKTLNSEKKQ